MKSCQIKFVFSLLRPKTEFAVFTIHCIQHIFLQYDILLRPSTWSDCMTVSAEETQYSIYVLSLLTLFCIFIYKLSNISKDRSLQNSYCTYIYIRGLCTVCTSMHHYANLY